ncbi:hypothetical protein JXQ31_07550 [candidate division KSB1 bacterium]|nr:hypothetical protein [candidate division KSB1 bacterium]
MWRIIYVLPNIELKAPIEENYIAIVPSQDTRIKEIISSNPYAKSLVTGFKNKYKNKINPSFILIDAQAPDIYFKQELIFGFRNIFALSIIIEKYECELQKILSPELVGFSNYFDFYPLTISKQNDGFITLSPAVGELAVGSSYFQGQSNPSLSVCKNLSFGNNFYLFNLLKKTWERRFIKSNLNEWKTSILFRSLDMAYKAMELPSIGSPSIYDMGTKASLWVSAFEILSHPRKSKVNLITVLDLLGEYKWEDRKLKNKYHKLKHGNQRYGRINFVQNLYQYLYKIRNDFLHGNPVKETCLYPFGNKSFSSQILKIAPLLYKVALLQFLDHFRDRRRRFDPQKYCSMHFCKKPLEKAILELKNIKKL